MRDSTVATKITRLPHVPVVEAKYVDGCGSAGAVAFLGSEGCIPDMHIVVGFAIAVLHR
jgi:hypothetical protein